MLVSDNSHSRSLLYLLQWTIGRAATLSNLTFHRAVTVKIGDVVRIRIDERSEAYHVSTSTTTLLCSAHVGQSPANAVTRIEPPRDVHRVNRDLYDAFEAKTGISYGEDFRLVRAYKAVGQDTLAFVESAEEFPSVSLTCIGVLDAILHSRALVQCAQNRISSNLPAKVRSFSLHAPMPLTGKLFVQWRGHSDLEAFKASTGELVLRVEGLRTASAVTSPKEDASTQQEIPTSTALPPTLFSRTWVPTSAQALGWTDANVLLFTDSVREQDAVVNSMASGSTLTVFSRIPRRKKLPAAVEHVYFATEAPDLSAHLGSSSAPPCIIYALKATASAYESEKNCGVLLAVLSALARSQLASVLVVVTEGSLHIHDNVNTAGLAEATIPGLVKALETEAPHAKAVCVDVQSHTSEQGRVTAICDAVSLALNGDYSSPVHYKRNGQALQRLVPVMQPLEKRARVDTQAAVRSLASFASEVWVVSGMSGSIMDTLAPALAERRSIRHIIALGRRDRLAPGAWLAQIENKLPTFCDLSYVQVDMTDYEQVRGIFASIIQHHGRIDGVLQAAGVLEPALLADPSQSLPLRATFDIKIRATLNLHKAAPSQARFVLLSSFS